MEEMKAYTVEVRIPMVHFVEVEAMNEEEAERLAVAEVESGAVGEGEIDGIAVAVSVEEAQ